MLHRAALLSARDLGHSLMLDPTRSSSVAQMWQDKAGADADGKPVAATTLGESAGNALTPGALSAVPALAPNGGSAGGGNGPAAASPQAGAPPPQQQQHRWSFVTGGRSLSMLRPSGVAPK